MKRLALILLLSGLSVASAQTIKTLGYDTTNGRIVAATNVIWTNAFSFSTNVVAAQVRTNLGLRWSALTNTNATSFRAAIGLGTNDTVTLAYGSEAYIGQDGGALLVDNLYPGYIQCGQFGISFDTTNSAAVTRTNLGLGWSALTNTNAINFKTAIGLGYGDSPAWNFIIVNSVSSQYGGMFEDEGGGEINVLQPLTFGVNVLGTRNNLGLGATWLTNTNVTNFRTAIELGSAATNNVSAFQPSSANLTNLASNNAVNLTNFPALLLRTNGSASALTNFPTLNQNTTGTASNITGVVAISNGGTGASDPTNARTNLGLGTAATNATSDFESARVAPYILDVVSSSTLTLTNLPNSLQKYKYVRIICIGGGGGGGGGRKDTGATVGKFGGGGGGGGSYAEAMFPISAITNATSIGFVIGLGGSGGAAVASGTASGNGGNGTDGGTTSAVINAGASPLFTITAMGGTFGYGGTTSSGTGGLPQNMGGFGGDSSSTRSSVDGTATSFGAGGGGAGGGVNSDNTSSFSGSDGRGSSLLFGTQTAIGGAAGTGASGANASAISQSPTAFFLVGGCGGGGGGGSRTGASGNNGGNGGNGSTGGGGGGGGSTSVTGASSGAGGNGGNGIARVIFY